jgi:hypothetical protein
MAAVTRGLYHRWYGLAVDIAQMTPGDPAEDINKTAILRVTDEYFCTDNGFVYWWNGISWIKI